MAASYAAAMSSRDRSSLPCHRIEFYPPINQQGNGARRTSGTPNKWGQNTPTVRARKGPCSAQGTVQVDPATVSACAVRAPS
jgi:hypothetical protein